MLAVVFLGAAVATHLFEALVPAGAREFQGSDYASYYQPTATSLLAGTGYSTPAGVVQTRVPPGYPLLLAAVQRLARSVGAGDKGAVRFLMTLSMGLGATAIFLIARMLWSPLSALVSSALWMTFPFTQFLTLQFGSDVPFMPVFYAATAFFLHGVLNGAASRAPFFVAGLLTGAAMLIRPIAIGLGGVFALLLLFVPRGRPYRLRAILVASLLLGNAAVVLPWEAWLYLKTGRLILLSDAGSSSLLAGWTFGLRPGQPAGRQPFDQDVSDLMHEFATEENGDSLRTILGVLVRESLRHPGAVARLTFLKLTRCWYGTESFRFEPTILFVQAFYLPLLLFAGWRALRAGPEGRLATLCTGLLILYFWGMTFMVVPLLRYMSPVQALAFVLLPAAFRLSRESVRVPTS